MSGRLDGRIAVVVGAGQTPGATIGNGRATAVTFAREGAKVVLVDRDADRLEEAAADLDAEHALIAVDVTADDAPERIVQGAIDAFGGIDVLHNNVGIGMGDGSPHQLADDAWDHIMDVNLRSTWRVCKAATPALRASGRGVITNVSSLAAIAAARGLTAYKVSKAGVNALTQALAMANAKHGVRANAIMPGFVDTPMGVDAPASSYGLDRDEYADARAQLVPMGRQGSAWDVANAALFLASDEAAFITGVILPVDGGQAARVG